MSEKTLRTGRIISSVAATLMALACGTNYVYSAWGPQFAEKLKLSATESNLIGTAGNLGMYSVGIPVGILVDHKGVRLAVILGAILLALGYFPLHQAYDNGSGSVPLLCLYSFFTGVGGCSAFAAAIKASALNWPHHRGTATAFPLAAFGLSAFFFSSVSTVIAPGDVGDFLMLLASGTSGLVFITFFFLRVYPNPAYTSIRTTDDVSGLESNPLHRTKSEDSRRARRSVVAEPGVEELEATDESSSLVSKASSSESGNDFEENSINKDHHHHIDIRGWQMVPTVEFWQLFLLMGILTGIGLMTINNIGNDATALWQHYDDSVSSEFILQQQAIHVSILSVCSFLGRLLSGVGSDFLVKRLHASRYWCLNIASVIFFIAQICALQIENPAYLGFVSGFTGLAYGFLFGCYPSLVAEAFGVHGLSQNWGCMTLAPVVSGNIFNLFYGLVFDHHSFVLPSGERQCPEGLYCYRNAYWLTFGSCILGFLITLWSIHHAHVKAKKEKSRDLEAREA